MPRDRGKELNDAHNKGQSDAAKGVYEPPGSALNDILGGEMKEDREAYQDGHAQNDK